MEYGPFFRRQIAWITMILAVAAPVWGQSAADSPLPTLPAQLDLVSAQRIALAANPTLAAAAERTQQAAQQLRQVQSAWWPRLDATAYATRSWLADSDAQARLATARMMDPGAAIDDPEDYYRTGLTATWQLFDGFARKYRLAGARLGLDESGFARDDARRLLLSGVAQAFYNAQLLKEGVRIAQADEAFNQRQVLEAEARHRVGTGSRSAVLNFQVQANSARSSMIQAQNAFEASLYGLAALMGYPDGTFPHSVELAALAPATPAELTPPVAQPLIAAAIIQRPDVRGQTLRVARSETDIGTARAAFWPQVNLFGNLEGDRTTDSAFETDDFGNSLGLNLTLNLFEGGRTQALVREARSRQKEADHLLLSLKNRVAAEIRQALTELASALQRLALERDNAGLVEENRNLVEKEYAAGQASLVRLNDAQRQLTLASVRLARARVALRQAWVQLDTATGAILDRFDESTAPTPQP